MPNAHTPGSDETLKVTRAFVFGEAAYESGGASAFTADVAIGDALDRATMLLSADRSGIQRPSFAIDDLAPDEERSPREIAEGVNAFHNWVLKLDVDDRPIFRPRPTAPLVEIGEWQGADLVDASGNSGAEIYNRCIVRGVGSDGTPVVVERTAGQQPGAIAMPTSSPAPSNPGLDVNTAGWSALSGSLTRDTSNFHSSPASLNFDVHVSGALVGSFVAGVAYQLAFWVYVTSLGAVTAIFGDVTTGDAAPLELHPAARTWTQVVLSWTPTRTTASVTLDLRIFAGTANVDDLALGVVRPTLVDRRNFRRTFVLKPGFKITPGSGRQLADTFLAAHRTTPYRGSCRIVPGGARYVLGGSSPHPSALLTMTQEMLRLSHRVDPDTGGAGRSATIDTVTYTHRDEASDVDLDDPRGNFDALMARMAEVQGTGS
jgi:hypothetical protein